MNKTGIGWTDMTWNPITGCYHGCEYCYAARIAHRFKNRDEESLQAAKVARERKMVMVTRSNDPYPL